MDRINTVKELPFRIGFTGYSGHLRIEPLPPVEGSNPLNFLPDFILPPAFPRETPESVKEHIEEKYLFPRLDPDEFSPEKAGKQWDFDWFSRAKVDPDPSLARTVVVPVWELPFRRKKPEVGIWEPKSVEVDVLLDLRTGAEDSGALPRMTRPPKDFVKGSINNRPFRPGGLNDTQGRTLPSGASNGEWVWELINGGPALKVPPSFKKGLDVGDLQAHPYSWNVYNHQKVAKISSDDKLTQFSVQFDDLFRKAWEEDSTDAVEDGVKSLRCETNEGNIQEKEGEDHEESVKLEQVELEPETEKINVLDVGVAPNDLSVLDNILSIQTEGSPARLNKNKDADSQRHKEVWAVRGNNESIADHFQELVPDMALEFPFELDTFQKEAIYHLEKGESVFVAAHTSAGKTVVAEYAFALASKHCTRAVYTAPIKTISNQKYRDFCGKFDVGLLTGDVSIRPEASCLIMTTEILRSMLYRGADIIRDIEWVIFDEVHYVNDVERGVVWEEVIIMLPRHINIILLSATVPNTMEFADWIGRTKQKKICVTGTSKRPVPLEHLLFYTGQFFKVCENEKFMPQGWKDAKDADKKKSSYSLGSSPGMHPVSSAIHDKKNQKHDKRSGSRNHGNLSVSGNGFQNNASNWGSKRSEGSPWLLLIHKLANKSLLPVVIFCFSKNRCDKSADYITSLDLTSKSEKSEIRTFCDKAFSRLKGSDKNLPQVVRVQHLLRRGIGIHHAGLLPIVKEVVEMLFCRGVIKVLFSTETFAMGVNAPARTVVFDTLRKFDGKEFRQLLAGEYTQMAGRAGRRGLDKIGTVIVMCRDEIPEESDLKHVMVGSATRLESQFRLTYIMILHLIRVEELKVEDMLKRSFAEFHAQKKLPEQQQLLLRKLALSEKVIECIKGEPSIEEYYDMLLEAEGYSSQISEALMQSPLAMQFLSSGRVIVVRSQSGQNHLLGVVLKSCGANNSKRFIVLVLTPESPSLPSSSSFGGKSSLKKEPDFQILMPKSKRGFDDDYCSSLTSRKGTGIIQITLPHQGSAAGVNYEVKEVDGKEIMSICDRKIKIEQVRLLEEISSAAYSKTVQQLLDLKSDGNKYPPPLHPVKDLKLKDWNTTEAYDKRKGVLEAYNGWNNLLQGMASNKCHGCVKLEEHIKLAQEKKKHKDEVTDLKFQMSDEALKQMPDFQGRIDVLKEVGCMDGDLVVQIKGRVACEMNSGEELICTEFLFDNQLDDLEPEEAVAIMSAFVFQQKNTSEPCLTPKLSLAMKRLHNTAVRLGELQAQCRVQINPEEYVTENLKFGLVEVVYEWAKGTPFAEICELTDVPEGLIVRTIVRLDETCREFRSAAAIMGNSALSKKMEAASNAIKRDIVFAASLYITGV